MRLSVSKRAEYCVFRVGNSPYWQVKFYDYEKTAYACRRSTGVSLDRPKRDAEKIARQLLQAGVLTAKDGPDTGFIAYLTAFWQPDGDYCRKAAAVKGKPISPTYVKNNLGDIRLHIATYPPFGKMKLTDVTTGDLEKWQLWARETHGITGNRANACLKLLKIALSQAAHRGDIPNDPSKAVARAKDDAKEKGILSEMEAAAVCALPLDKNPHKVLLLLLGLCCGMRRGEVRGLRWGDIKEGYIDITHNYITHEGEKAPKCGSARQVPFGINGVLCLDGNAVVDALEAVRATSRHIGPDDFVLESPVKKGEPISKDYFGKSLAPMLEALGITSTEQKDRNISFHSLRHTFITLARRGGVDDLTVQTFAGHADIKMTDHYTHAGQQMDIKAYSTRGAKWEAA